MDKWDIYPDAARKWRWRRKAPNGEIVGASTEGYHNRADCVENARRHGYQPEPTEPTTPEPPGGVVK